MFLRAVPQFDSTADLRAHYAKGSGLSAAVIDCPDHGRSWFAVFLSGIWLPEYGPSSGRVEMLAEADGGCVVYGGPPTMPVVAPCRCEVGRAGPHVVTEFFDLEDSCPTS